MTERDKVQGDPSAYFWYFLLAVVVFSAMYGSFHAGRLYGYLECSADKEKVIHHAD